MMTITEQKIDQLQEWLAAADDDWRLEAMIDLPDLIWITVETMLAKDGLLRLSYRIPFNAFMDTEGPPSELVCPAVCVRAIRRVPSAKATRARMVGSFLDDMNSRRRESEKGDRG